MATRLTIVEQLPRFLQFRRRTWKGLQAFLDESHLPRPAFFLLRALEEETTEGETLTIQQMQKRLFNPYTTHFPVANQLPLLVERGYLEQQGEGYFVTETGRTLSREIEYAARSYIATIQLPVSLDLPRLAAMLVGLVHRAWQSPEPAIKAHQTRTQRRLSIEGAPALVQIEWAILGLWEARDDAHIAAWRAYGFSGPVFDILSRVWQKEARTLSDLHSLLDGSQLPMDIDRGVAELVTSGHLITKDDVLELTPQGQTVREAIEVETNRIFFSPWSYVRDDEMVWLSEQLKELSASFEKLSGQV